MTEPPPDAPAPRTPLRRSPLILVAAGVLVAVLAFVVLYATGIIGGPPG